ncbi:MAG: choice-of-anchor tandem repeat GloVer-containing protein, partial [Terriglobales bacterium]
TQGGSWQETVVHAFTGGADGAFPFKVTFNSSGGLLGTAFAGGNTDCSTLGCGVAFELTPNSGGWIENILYSFSGGADGESPWGNLIPGPNGNLYGVTNEGGANGKAGTVFELVPTRSGTWTKQSLSLGGKLGANPYAGLTLGASGREVYGTTSGGGAGHEGTVFELLKQAGTDGALSVKSAIHGPQ